MRNETGVAVKKAGYPNPGRGDESRRVYRISPDPKTPTVELKTILMRHQPPHSADTGFSGHGDLQLADNHYRSCPAIFSIEQLRIILYT